MSQSPSVNVIIVNMNGRRYLEKCLSSISDQTYRNYKVTLVDNGSTDGSLEYVREHFPKVTVLDLKVNCGFAKGNNKGFESDSADYVITLNNDAWVDRDFIEVLVREAENNSSVASVGCKIVQAQDGLVRYGPQFIDRRLFIYKSPYLLRDPEQREYEIRSRVVANCACAALYRSSTLRKVGFFDEDFSSNYEDHDLGYRINLAGFLCIYTPATTVYHIGGGSEGSISNIQPRRLKLIVRNQLYTYLKNYEPTNLIKVLPVTLITFAGWSFVLWLHGNTSFVTQSNFGYKRKNPFPLITAFLEGTLAFIKAFPTALVSRRRIQALRVVPDRRLFEDLSIHNFAFYPLRSKRK